MPTPAQLGRRPVVAQLHDGYADRLAGRNDEGSELPVGEPKIDDGSATVPHTEPLREVEQETSHLADLYRAKEKTPTASIKEACPKTKFQTSPSRPSIVRSSIATPTVANVPRGRLRANSRLFRWSFTFPASSCPVGS